MESLLPALMACFKPEVHPAVWRQLRVCQNTVDSFLNPRILLNSLQKMLLRR